jgi:hypothetical protein
VQNNAQDGGPLMGNIMKISPGCECSHNGGVVAMGKEPSFASIRCVLAAYKGRQKA